MASLIDQLEMIDKQRLDLLEKIKVEEEMNRKLAQDASIERLETLIDPITQFLNSVPSHYNQMWRQTLENEFIKKKRRNDTTIKYQSNHMLANEEIFVTLLGIIKKQDARINQLEELVLKEKAE